MGFQRGAAPFGIRLCLQSLVCYTLVLADAEKGLREVPESTCSAAEGCADGHGSWRFLSTQRRLAEEPMVYVLLPAAAAFSISGRNCVNLTRFLSANLDIPPRQFQPQIIHSLFLGLFSVSGQSSSVL